MHETADAIRMLQNSHRPPPSTFAPLSSSGFDPPAINRRPGGGYWPEKTAKPPSPMGLVYLGIMLLLGFTVTIVLLGIILVRMNTFIQHGVNFKGLLDLLGDSSSS